jgi:hypothetical protein
MFIIRTLQLARAHDSAQDSAPDSAPDSADFLASAEIEAVAQELGFWDPASGPLDFTAAFSGNSLVVDPTGRKQLVNRFYAGRRIWRVFDLLAPALQLDADEGVFQVRDARAHRRARTRRAGASERAHAAGLSGRARARVADSRPCPPPRLARCGWRARRSVRPTRSRSCPRARWACPPSSASCETTTRARRSI